MYGVDRRPLEVPAYRRLWVASVVAAVCGSFSVIAVPAEVFSWTGSSVWVAAAAVVAFLGLVVASLWGGALADVVDRRRLLLGAQSLLAGSYALFWVQAAVGLRSVPVLLALVGCQGVGLGAIMTTMGAVVPRLVPVELLAAASGLSSLVRYAGAMLGPLLAGVLIPWVGLSTLYLFDATALLVVLAAVFRLPALPPTGVRAPVTPGRIGAGFGYLARHRLLVGVLGIDLAAMVFGWPVAVFPQLASGTYGGARAGGLTLGLLYAAYPAGVFGVGLVSEVFTRTRRPGALMASAALVWGLLVVVCGLAPWFWLALVALVLGGAANFVLSTCRNAVTSAGTDDEMRGRTQGSMTMLLVGGPQLANVLHGVGAAVLGARPTICLGGVLTMVAVGTLAHRVQPVRQYRIAHTPGPRRPVSAP